MDPSSLALIGITTNATAQPDWSDLGPSRALDYVFQDYTRAVEDAGGIPVLLPALNTEDALRSAVSRFDGLLLTGGPDVSPRLYGQQPRPGIGIVDPERDRWELLAVQAAMDRGIPLLAICRGIQVLAVAFGGSLYQDIRTQVPDCLEHWQRASRRFASHSVNVDDGSRLRAALGRRRVWVNSHHHQAVCDPPPDFVVTARATDGLVEGMEHSGSEFTVGVQWHPEGASPEDKAARGLFEAFVQAAKHR
jgi:putative glutamine amidotransferase